MLVAVSAQSIAAVQDVADLVQVRALVVIADRGSVSLGELAEAMSIHLTRASRLCERLVKKGLVDRADDPDNRRQLTLTLTQLGQRVVGEVMRRRRDAIQSILSQLGARVSSQGRADMLSLWEEFAAAGGEPSDRDLWAMGWST
ncbi:MAG: MarR family transcriptional regulator [Actinobacteria bacterium]|nr:MarR family transcriptional regulator [Actinomycetota bacterium]